MTAETVTTRPMPALAEAVLAVLAAQLGISVAQGETPPVAAVVPPDRLAATMGLRDTPVPAGTMGQRDTPVPAATLGRQDTRGVAAMAAWPDTPARAA